MSKNRIIPQNMISANDAARMIIRGSLILAPSDMREQYTAFVRPVNMGNYGSEGAVSQKVRDIFNTFVKELEKIQFPEEKTPTLQEIKNQVANTLTIATTYIKILKNYKKNTDDKSVEIILQQLKTITENINSRTIVLTYPTPKTSTTDSYGSLNEENNAILDSKKRPGRT